MAKVKILHTGMTECFDAQGSVIDCHNSGQDAAAGAGLFCSGPRFNAVSAELVEDSLTGLFWSKDCGLVEYPLSWEDSLALIEEMNQEKRFDRSDWRLPNRREMRSLIDHSRPSSRQLLYSHFYMLLQHGTD